MPATSLPSFTKCSIDIVVGRYQIVRALGHSSQADVYLAKDFQRRRPAAIKILRPDVVARLGADRLLQQIASAADLKHRHILPIDDFGVADLSVYYTMPNAESSGLRALLTEYYRLPLARATTIAMDVAEALHFGHEHGVTHGRLSPDNVFLVNGRAMLADFGIGNETADAVRPTDDVFGLGGVFHEMLTGEPPEPWFDERVIAHARASDTPSLHHTILAALPHSVIHALARALAEKPTERFEHCARFRDALTAIEPSANGRPARLLQPVAA